jgi:hypothetical protein
MIGFSLNRWMRVSWLALREMGDLQEFTMAEVREPRARVSIGFLRLLVGRANMQRTETRQARPYLKCAM